MYYLQWNSKNLDHVNQGFWRITVHSLAWLNWWAKISWHRPFKLIKYSMFSGIFCFIQQKDSAVRLCTYLSYMYSVYCSGRGSKTVYNVFYFGRFSFLLTADHQREVVQQLLLPSDSNNSPCFLPIANIFANMQEFEKPLLLVNKEFRWDCLIHRYSILCICKQMQNCPE